MKKLQLIKNDPFLEPFEEVIQSRIENYYERKQKLKGKHKSLSNFANGHNYFGLHKTQKEWVFREWAPNATNIFMVGDFSNWEIDPKFGLSHLGNGIWEVKLPLKTLKHNDFYKLNIAWGSGQGFRIPAWANRVVQDEETKIFTAQIWDPPKKYEWKNSTPKLASAPIIYEAHVGMSSKEEKISTYTEFRKNVLPRVIKNGYNTLQLMAVQEHPYYGSFGYHVSNFFAASSRFGTPEELKQLIDEAHGAGIKVIMDIVHSHAVKNEDEGLSKFDGSYYQYFHEGGRGSHIAWDSRCFDYGKHEVIHFLLSNCKYWLEEYKFDGFRFDGITSMLYYDHGLSRDFTNYEFYYDQQQDEDAITYLMMANELIHEINDEAITIAEEMSGMPGITEIIDEGGYGFDYRLAMGVPDYWIKIIKEKIDEEWNVEEMFYECTNQRSDEKSITYVESHDQALVGDKTISFRLMDQDMYYNMGVNQESIIVDRGMALHKMIRLFTISTGGSGYLNFMGNEFGHPEWIDFPSATNGWSYKHARRQWNLVDDDQLKYKYLNLFDQKMIELIRAFNILDGKDLFPILSNVADQIIAFERNDLLFVFNFNPTQSFTDYGINTKKGRYKILLNTDSKIFDGHQRVDEDLIYKTILQKETDNNQLWLYLPSQSAIVFRKIP